MARFLLLGHLFGLMVNSNWKKNYPQFKFLELQPFNELPFTNDELIQKASLSTVQAKANVLV